MTSKQTKATPPSCLLHPGMVLPAGYRLRRLLKRTKHTEIWKAVTADDRPRAIKLIQLGDKQALEHDVRLLEALREMKHGQLISIDWLGFYRNSLVLAMELAQASLDDLFNKQLAQFGIPWPARKVCRYLAQAARALDFLNSRQHRYGECLVSLPHGNLKPSNLLRVENAVRVTDIKLSSQASFEQSNDRLSATLRYAAPEVHHGWISEYSDQYSLAVMYCEFRGGRLPFQDTPSVVDAGHRRGEPELTMLPQCERDPVARALAVPPDDRWPSCAAFVARLAEVSWE